MIFLGVLRTYLVFLTIETFLTDAFEDLLSDCLIGRYHTAEDNSEKRNADDDDEKDCFILCFGLADIKVWDFKLRDRTCATFLLTLLSVVTHCIVYR